MMINHDKLDENPVKNTNIFSKLIYGWVVKIFWLRLKRQLCMQDLYKPLKLDESERLGDELEAQWTKELLRAKSKGKEPKLLTAIIKMFLGKSIIAGVTLLVYSLIGVAQPLLLAQLLHLIAESKELTPDQVKWKYIYGGSIAVATLAKTFLYNHYLAFNFILGMRIRIAICSLLYRKMLRLKHSSISKITAGHLVNLLSNDVNRFDLGLPYMHYFWTMPIQVVVGIALIWTQVQISSLAGVLTMAVITIPIQGFLGALTSKYRLKVANRTDTRVKHMNEIIGGIQVIKMYAWEEPFEKIIAMLRKREISAVKKSSILKAIYLSFIVFTDRLSLFATIICYLMLGNTISSEKVFSLAQFYNVLQISMAVGFPLAVNMGAEILVSIRRFEEYLMLEENPRKAEKRERSDGKVAISNVYAYWSPENDFSLTKLNVTVHAGSLCTLVGSVGSGKSSILHLVLEELQPANGTVHVGGDVSYASQEPWLFVASVRENILFGRPYERERYKEIVRVCALEKDFEQLPYGDRTIVGEKGVALSGGQRARINLARAVYRQTEIYLLDDPLSAVDTHVSKHLFEECISGYLRNKTRILVTHQLQYLKRADLIVVINEGQIIAQGTFNEIVQSDLDINQYLTIEEKKEEQEVKEIKRMSRRISVISTASTVLEAVEMDFVEEEMGDSKNPVYWPYFRAGGGYFRIAFLFLLLISSQAILNGSDIWLTYWISTINGTAAATNNTDFSIRSVINNDTFTNTEYLYNYTDTDSTEHKPIEQTKAYIYTGLIFGTVFLTFYRSIFFFITCMKSSIRLHNAMFHSLLQTFMRFFDTNPSGRILNRFSKDTGTMDEVIPKTMLEAIQVMLVMTGILVVIILTNPYMAIAVAVLWFIGYKLAVLYTNAAKDIKRLEGITRSPVFSHIKASYDGLVTIRSSNSEMQYKDEFDDLQNVHTSAWYLTIATRTAFGIWLDLFTIVFITIVIYSFIFLNEVNETFTDSKAGLAISQSLILTGMVQLGSQQVTEVINQMTSVERILEYTKLEKEKSFQSERNANINNWPTYGALQFKKLFLRYSSLEPPVLKNLSFSISPGQKVGIVGRTGAGKSSIISAMFRLAPIEGSILIDNQDTKSIDLGFLRSKISIIPQVPVLFSAPVRYNLDPFDEYTDEQIWNALDEVELKESLPNLDFFVNEGGANFSVGQRQLLCLARAILRDNKILILDEATANVDQQTDALIQSTIRRKFSSCTVLTIAHRLNTIMDADMIIVMQAGEMVEMGHPYVLLQNKDGHFQKLVGENEESVAKKLLRIASETYLDTLIEEEDVTNL